MFAGNLVNETMMLSPGEMSTPCAAMLRASGVLAVRGLSARTWLNISIDYFGILETAMLFKLIYLFR
jgi:hypothetical protein